LQRELELKIADDKAVRLDLKKSSVADFASAFIDDAVARVRGAAAAKQISDVETLTEGLLVVLNERITYFLAHLSPEEKDLLLEWLVSAVVGGYSHDFLRRFISMLAAEPAPGGGPGGEGQGG
jgi:hypothetical protein